ncbi:MULTISPECIES: hypothetical protein [Burkholderia]|uniref:hypothetical protein n=1 Tax=Burkholderia TaxID=32008 RepID=UPI000B1E0D7D|nr:MULTISPECIES: hypothetical protein [Burkholderia]MCA7985372.1 hypothetical protein [Burkholderia vietnamiensis]HDR8932827.1 hypothetical protein [Burkholderia vietnamiensis]
MNEYDIEIVQGKLDTALLHIHLARRQHGDDRNLTPAARAIEEAKGVLEGSRSDFGA